MYALWLISFFSLGLYFTFYVSKINKHNYCVPKTKWIGISFIIISLFLGIKIKDDFIANGMHQKTFEMFQMARYPAAGNILKIDK